MARVAYFTGELERLRKMLTDAGIPFQSTLEEYLGDKFYLQAIFYPCFGVFGEVMTCSVIADRVCAGKLEFHGLLTPAEKVNGIVISDTTADVVFKRIAEHYAGDAMLDREA